MDTLTFGCVILAVYCFRNVCGDGHDTEVFAGDLYGRGIVINIFNDARLGGIQVVLYDGYYIIQGDIIIWGPDMDSSKLKLLGTVVVDDSWSCPIPYSNELPAFRDRVPDAIGHWEAHTKWRFIERTDETDYIAFGESNGCSSYIGRMGGRQEILLSSACDVGNTIHEIGHALGFWHEHSRYDRDSFIEVNFDNICCGAGHNFYIIEEEYSETLAPYDYGSIMHYGETSWSEIGRPTIVTIPPGIPIGQRDGLSDSDITTANILYDRAYEKCEPETTEPECTGPRIACDNGDCISGSICDGTNDCPDGSDEEDCSTSTPTAPTPVSPTPSSPVPVSPVTGICADTFPGRALGDRMYNTRVENLGQCCEECLGTSVCVAWAFYLGSGECILRSTFEMFQDSEGWESGRSTPSPSSSLTVGTGETTECAEYQIACDSGMCIMEPYVCDGIRDCPDGDDEDNCSPDAMTPTAPVPVSPVTETEECKSWEAACDNGFCIPALFFCDGLTDCSDGSDEDNCSSEPTTPITQTRPSSSREMEQCGIMKDVRISGERVKSKGKETWQDCCDFCMDEADCIAWAFHEDHAIEDGKGDCILRSGDLSSQHNAGWVSGKFTDL